MVAHGRVFLSRRNFIPNAKTRRCTLDEERDKTLAYLKPFMCRCTANPDLSLSPFIYRYTSDLVVIIRYADKVIHNSYVTKSSRNLPAVLLFRITYRLRKNNLLIRAELHCLCQSLPVDGPSHDSRQSFGSAVEIDILADEACIGG